MRKAAQLTFDVSRVDNEFSNGFRGYKSIPENYSLMFEWSGPMVMDRCHIPLSAAFLDEDNTIVDIKKMIPEPDTYVPENYYQSDKPYVRVLEAEDGWFDRNGWGVGDRLHVDGKSIRLQDGSCRKNTPLSVLSPPTPTLDSSMWDISTDRPCLKPALKREILERLFDGLKRNGFESPKSWITDVFLVGSSTTNQFDETSDIDVGFTVDKASFKRKEPRYRDLSDKSIDLVIKRAIIDQINDKLLFDTSHSVNYYYNKPEDKSAFDSLYDIVTDLWERGPTTVPLDFNPEEEFPDVWDDARRLAEGFDIGIGNLRRDSIDTENIFKRIENSETPERYKCLLNKIIFNIEKEIHKLTKGHEDVWQKRKIAFSRDPDELRTLWNKSKNFSPENIRYKLLEKWRYIKLLHELEKIWAGDEPKENRVMSIANLFKLSSKILRPLFKLSQTSDDEDLDLFAAKLFDEVAAKQTAAKKAPAPQQEPTEIPPPKPTPVAPPQKPKGPAAGPPAAVGTPPAGQAPEKQGSDTGSGVPAAVPSRKTPPAAAPSNAKLAKLSEGQLRLLLPQADRATADIIFSILEEREKTEDNPRPRVITKEILEVIKPSVTTVKKALTSDYPFSSAELREYYDFLQDLLTPSFLSKAVEHSSTGVTTTTKELAALASSEEYTDSLRLAEKVASDFNSQIAQHFDLGLDRPDADAPEHLDITQQDFTLIQKCLQEVITKNDAIIANNGISAAVIPETDIYEFACVYAEQPLTSWTPDIALFFQQYLVNGSPAIKAILGESVFLKLTQNKPKLTKSNKSPHTSDDTNKLSLVGTPRRVYFVLRSGNKLEVKLTGSFHRKDVYDYISYEDGGPQRIKDPEGSATTVSLSVDILRLPIERLIKFLEVFGVEVSEKHTDFINSIAEEVKVPSRHTFITPKGEVKLAFTPINSKYTSANVALSGLIKPLTELPEVPGLTKTLYDYQKAGVMYTVAHRDGCILADDMGTGKTLTVLSALKVAPDGLPCLAIIPVHLTGSWRDEITDSFTSARNVEARAFNLLMWNKTDDITETTDIPPNTIILTSNNAISLRKKLATMQALISEKKIRTVVVDEAEYIKTETSSSSISVTALMSNPALANKILMTATPMTLSPLDAIPYLTAIGKIDLFGGVDTFKNNFCNPKSLTRMPDPARQNSNANYKGQSNLPILHKMLRSSCMLFRPSESIVTQVTGGEMPKINYNFVDVDLAKENLEDLWYQYQDPASAATRKIVEQTHPKEGEEDEEYQASILSILDKRAGRNASDATKLACALVKIPTAVKLSNKIRASDPKAKILYLVYSHDVRCELQARLEQNYEELNPGFSGKNTVVHYMGGKKKEREENLSDFKKTDDVNDLILGFSAGRTGLNIAAAHYVICVELPWTWAALTQAVHRAYRMGDPHDVEAYIISVVGANADGNSYGDSRAAERIERRKGVHDVPLHGANLLDFSFNPRTAYCLSKKFPLALKTSGVSGSDDPVQASLKSSCTLTGDLGDSHWIGSGFRINDTDILTCAHNVVQENRPPYDKNTTISVSFGEDSEVTAKPLFINYSLDLAVIRIPDLESRNISGFPLLLGDNEDLSEGDDIYSVGSPEGVNAIVTAGVVSSDFRSVSELDAPVFFTDMDLHPGSSGGPVCNLRGEVVGIARGTLAFNDEDSGSWDNLNYVLPIDVAKNWLTKKGISFRQGVNHGVSKDG